MTAHHRAPIVSLLVLACLAACGGSSGGGGGGDSEGGGEGGNGGGNGGTTGAGFSFHLISQGGLNVVDPLDPTRIIEVDTQHNTYELVFGGTVAPGTGVIEGEYLDSVIYVNANHNRVYRIPMQIERIGGVAQPPLVQSITTTISDAFELWVGTDLAGAEPGNTIVLENSQGFEVCQQTGGSVTALQPFPGRPVAELVDPATAAFLGWLVHDGTQLLATDPTGGSETFLVAATEVSSLGTTQGGVTYLNVDGDPCSYGMDGEFHQLVAPTPSAGMTSVVLGEELFFAAQVSTSVTVNRTGPMGPVQPFFTASGDIEHLGATASRVLVSWRDPFLAAQQLASIRPDGSDPLLLASEGTIELLAPRFHGETVFFNGVHQAHAVNSDGSSVVVRTGSSWLAPTYQDRRTVTGVAALGELVLWTNSSGSRWIETVSPTAPGEQPLRLGTLPAPYNVVEKATGMGVTSVLTAWRVLPFGVSNPDVFFFNSVQGDSVISVTGMSAGWESAIW